MKKMMNITTNAEDLDRFTDHSDLRNFYRGFGLDGLEVMQAGIDEKGIIHSEDVLGVHLKYFTSWMDLWNGNRDRLLKEFGTMETVEQVFGGGTREALLRSFIDNLAFAASVVPEYMVFHVSDCTMEESMLRKHYYTEEEVLDATAELVNEMTGVIKGNPLLLFENLWYPGLTMKSPELTRRLLDKVHYQNTGIMLDVGHLLHTNMNLQTLEEGTEYILSILKQYGDLSFIKGIHLHQTLSGEYSRKLMSEWKPMMTGTYYERYWQIMTHIYNIDSHQPFTNNCVNEIITAVAPEYLVLEQVSSSREEHGRMLNEQISYLQQGEPLF